MAYQLWGEVRDAEDALRIRQHLLQHPRVRAWGLSPFELVDPSKSTFAGVVSSLFISYARREGKVRWGDKTPDYVRSIPLLAYLFPTARFIHLVRDGRDVALSLKQQSWGSPNLHEAGRWWQTSVLAGIQHGRHLGPSRYFRLHFESLLDSPESTLRELLQWMGEDYSPAVLRRQAPHVAGIGLDAAEIVPGNREKWRRLPAAQQAELQAALEPTLSMLGYETSGASQPAPRWKAACYRLEALAQQRRAALGMPAIKLRWWAWRALQLQRPPIQEGAPDLLQKPMG